MLEADIDPERPRVAVSCPYCGRRLKWCDHQWAGLGVFVCAYCGEFPDFTIHADADGRSRPVKKVV